MVLGIVGMGECKSKIENNLSAFSANKFEIRIGDVYDCIRDLREEDKFFDTILCLGLFIMYMIIIFY